MIGADGLIYVNSEDTNEVMVFDPKSLAVKKRFPLGVAKIPTGLAYDAKTNRLFIGCRNEPKMVVMDAATGKAGAPGCRFRRSQNLRCREPGNAPPLDSLSHRLGTVQPRLTQSGSSCVAHTLSYSSRPNFSQVNS